MNNPETETQEIANDPTPSPEAIREPDRIRREGNHLKDQKSLYLLQHAHNPVDWYSWSREALERARKEDKPIFLSIGYSSCHWCHVMEKEVFEDDEVASFLNAHFVSIKVDREERPDLDSVYMEAVQAITGGGGWPMSVFLTPELKPFFGGTYFPKEQFLPLIRRIGELYRDDKKLVRDQASKLYAHVSRGLPRLPASAIDEQMLDGAAASALKTFDSKWGGTLSRMKFPTPLRWMFLLHHYRKTGDGDSASMVRKTLENMGSGGIQDHVDGGFHRYTVESTWLVPHFEKMLYDNALLASLYTEAAVVFEDDRFTRIAKDTLDFLIARMQGESGGFFSSFDADSGGEEGSFYVWTPEEITEVAGERDGPPLAMLLGVTPEGNFEGKTIFTRRVSDSEVAKRFGRPVGEVAELFDIYRPALSEYRSKRTPPGLDRKVITSWNGLAIAAMARGYAAFGEERYRQAAERAVDFLFARHFDADGRLLRASNDGPAENRGILDDLAYLADGLLELYNATGKQGHLRRAVGLIDHSLERFAHPEKGFYQTPDDLEAPMGRQVDLFDNARPSATAVMGQVLLRVATLTGDERYHQKVAETLESVSGLMGKAGPEMASWLDLAQRWIGPFYEVVVAGDPAGKDTRELLRTVRRRLAPWATVVSVPATGPDKETLALQTVTANKKALSGKATAYVCQRGSCEAPTVKSSELDKQLMEGWKR